VRLNRLTDTRNIIDQQFPLRQQFCPQERQFPDVANHLCRQDFSKPLDVAEERLQRHQATIGQDGFGGSLLLEREVLDQFLGEDEKAIECRIHPDRENPRRLGFGTADEHLQQRTPGFIHAAVHAVNPPRWIAAGWPMRITKEMRSG
jgi:hypothetical protein